MGSCCIDFDGPEFCTEVWRKAKKEHKCCECGATIQVGEEYEYISGKWDGYFSTYTTCEKCADLRASLAEATCPVLGELRAAYKEYLHDVGAIELDEEKDEYIYPSNHLLGQR